MSDVDAGGVPHEPKKHGPSKFLKPSSWSKPPDWVDWIHKLGPVIGILGALVIFGFTFYFTVYPSYTLSVLREKSSKLEIDLSVKEARVKTKEAEIQNLQQTIAEEDKKVQLLAADIEQRQKDIETLRTSSEKLHSELIKKEQDLSITQKRLLLARAESEPAFGVVRGLLMNDFDRGVNDLCLIPSINEYVKLSSIFYIGSPAIPPQFFSRYKDCFTAALKNEPRLDVLPEADRQKLRKLAGRFDKERLDKFAELDQEINRIEAKVVSMFNEATAIQTGCAYYVALPRDAYAPLLDVGDPNPCGPGILKSLTIQKEAQKLLSDDMQRLVEQFHDIIKKDIVNLRKEYLGN